MKTKSNTVVLYAMIGTHAIKEMKKKAQKLCWMREDDALVYYDKENDVKIALLDIYQKKYHGENCRYETHGGKDLAKRINKAAKNTGIGLPSITSCKLKSVVWSGFFSMDDGKQAKAFLAVAANAKSPEKMTLFEADEDHVTFAPFKRSYRACIEFTAEKERVRVLYSLSKEKCKALMERYDSLEKCLNNIEAEGCKRMKKALDAMFGTGKVLKEKDLLRKIGRCDCTDKARETLGRFAHTAKKYGTDAAIEEACRRHIQYPNKDISVPSIMAYFEKMGCSPIVLPKEAEDAFDKKMPIRIKCRSKGTDNPSEDFDRLLIIENVTTII